MKKFAATGFKGLLSGFIFLIVIIGLFKIMPYAIDIISTTFGFEPFNVMLSLGLLIIIIILTYLEEYVHRK